MGCLRGTRSSSGFGLAFALGYRVGRAALGAITEIPPETRELGAKLLVVKNCHYDLKCVLELIPAFRVFGRTNPILRKENKWGVGLRDSVLSAGWLSHALEPRLGIDDPKRARRTTRLSRIFWQNEPNLT